MEAGLLPEPGQPAAVALDLIRMAMPPSSDRSAVSCLVFSATEQQLAVGTSKGTVYVLSLSDPKRFGDKIEATSSVHKV